MIDPKEILYKYWNYSSFRNSQKEIIDKVLENNDVVALLPTGGGKSLCYQIPSLSKEGVCLVISPLISLMNDQIENLDRKGIKALTIKGNSTKDEIVRLFDTLKYGKTKFLYLSPERLSSEFIQQKIKETPINLIAIDEAHCISEWGHDFRPSYRHIKKIRKILPEVSMIALTATATKKVLEDIVNNLELKYVSIFKKSFFRENLAYQIFSLENKFEKLEQIFKKNPFPTIIYVNSRKKTEKISNYINSKGYTSAFYHGGMNTTDKSKAFNQWFQEEKKIIVATNAFGLGIDKPNVKVVIHLDLPSSIENYVQEAGRGGRNGEKSFSVVLQNKDDILSHKRNTLDKIPTIKEIKNVHRKLYQYFQIAKGEFPKTSFDFNFVDFCNSYKLNKKKTSSSIQILKSNGIIEVSSNFNQLSTLLFTVSGKQLLHQKYNSSFSKKVIDSILRSYPGVFQSETNINEFEIAKNIETNSSRVKKELNLLDAAGILKYKEANHHEKLLFLIPREDDLSINRVSKTIQKNLNQQIKKSNELVSFIENNTVCRSIKILNYFGEKGSTECHICDICISKNYDKSKDLQQQIISLLKKKEKLSKEEIISIIEEEEKTILINLRYLISKEIVDINNHNNFFLR